VPASDAATAWFNLPRKTITLECDRPFSSRSSRQATLEASNLSGVLGSIPLGPEFSTALDNAEAAQLACAAARRAYEIHCEEHGCKDEFYGPLR